VANHHGLSGTVVFTPGERCDPLLECQFMPVSNAVYKRP